MAGLEVPLGPRRGLKIPTFPLVLDAISIHWFSRRPDHPFFVKYALGNGFLSKMDRDWVPGSAQNTKFSTGSISNLDPLGDLDPLRFTLLQS